MPNRASACTPLPTPIATELDTPVTWTELRSAISKLSNGKAPGLNDVPPDAYKALSDGNLLSLLTFFNEYWEGKTDFQE